MYFSAWSVSQVPIKETLFQEVEENWYICEIYGDQK